MKHVIFMLALSCALLGSTKKTQVYSPTTLKQSQMELSLASESTTRQLYKELNLESKITYSVFSFALNGYYAIQSTKKVLTIIDFSKPSTQERLFVIDLTIRKLVYSSHVAHGRNSGELLATKFSNKIGSFQSSPGFYLTEGTYMGHNGYSLVLAGLEKGINNNAKERRIVVHGAAYANPSNSSRLGRSLGCPALPLSKTKPIINAIKNGSVLYISTNSQDYYAHTSYSTRI